MPGPKGKKYGTNRQMQFKYNGPGNPAEWRAYFQRDLNACKTYNDMKLFIKANVAKRVLCREILHVNSTEPIEHYIDILVNEQNEYRRNNAGLQLSQLNLDDSEDNIDAEAALEQMYMISQKPDDKNCITHLREHVDGVNNGMRFGKYSEWVDNTVKIGTLFYEFSTGRTYVPKYTDTCQIGFVCVAGCRVSSILSHSNTQFEYTI